jgi:hypothetical protein
MSIYESVNRDLAFMPLLIIGLGVVGNTLCFLIFRFTSEFKKTSSMVFLSFLALVDTASLFEWNLNHHTIAVYKFDIVNVNMATCKLLPFIQYASLQASGMLLSFMTLDRYVAVRSMPGSFYSRLPFNSVRSALCWSIGLLVLVGILNCHILILNGFYRDPEMRNRTVYNVTSLSDGQIINETTEQYIYQISSMKCYQYQDGFQITPTWDLVHMFIYSFIPAIIMVIFNALLIATTLWPAKHETNTERQRAQAKKTRLTISILAITFAFIILTLPATISYGLMWSWVVKLPWGILTLNILDYLSFLNHASLFLNCFMTNSKFRRAVKTYVRTIFGLCYARLK